MIEACSIIFGLLIGSFLSVCIYRIPLGRMTGLEELELDWENIDEEELAERERQANTEHFEKKVTIAYPPRSFCPSCGEQLKWYHNIPVLSWVRQGGKCAFCKERISFRYPLVELLSAFFCFLSFTQFPIPTALVIYAYVASLIVLSFIDIDYYLLPNVITYPGVLVGLLIAGNNSIFHVFDPPLVPGIQASLFGVLLGAGVLLLISEIYMRLRGKQGLGMGDVKLLGMTGAFFGLEGAIYTIFIGSLLGSAVGVVLWIVGRADLSRYLPFGPYLAVANLLYIYDGPNLMLRINQVVFHMVHS